MVLKIRLLRFTVKFGRGCLWLAAKLEAMQMSWRRMCAWLGELRWRRIIRWCARISAVGATVTGAMTVITSSSSASTGIALGAAGATGTYVSTKGIPLKGYEKIKHVSPKTSQRSGNTVNMHYAAPSLSKRNTAVSKPTVHKRGY